jgi:HEPN domain-containing protein
MSNNDKLNNNRELAQIWYSQAKFDLKAAKDSMNNKNFEWACFQAQQAGEKALKAYLYEKRKRNIFTHSIKRLVEEASEFNKNSSELKEARILDQYYIPTQHPNGLPGNIPHNYYIKSDAKKCVEFAQKIISQIGKILGKN